MWVNEGSSENFRAGTPPILHTNKTTQGKKSPRRRHGGVSRFCRHVIYGWSLGDDLKIWKSMYSQKVRNVSFHWKIDIIAAILEIFWNSCESMICKNYQYWSSYFSFWRCSKNQNALALFWKKNRLGHFIFRLRSGILSNQYDFWFQIILKVYQILVSEYLNNGAQNGFML